MRRFCRKPHRASSAPLPHTRLALAVAIGTLWGAGAVAAEAATPEGGSANTKTSSAPPASTGAPSAGSSSVPGEAQPAGEATAPSTQPELALVDRVAAVIEGEIVTLRELEKKANPYMGQLADISDEAEREERRIAILKQVLDIEIGEKMVAREIEANSERLGVTEKDVDRAIEEVLQMNKLNRDQLQAALYGQGMTWTEYRKKLREQIERARLIQFKVQGKIQLRDADVKRRCEQRGEQKGGAEQVCASHLLLKVASGASDRDVLRLRAKASQLQAELQSGADFAAYALKYSDDKAAPDGRLGCFGRGEMVEAFEKAAFGLPVGAVSAVVKTNFGFHVIKVTDRRSPEPPDCSSEEAMETFRNELYQEEMQRQMEAWIQSLRRKAFVDVRL